MRVALHAASSDCLKPIYDNEISKEETLELVVPDVNADIGKILDVRGQFLLSSQKAKADEVHISASVEVSIIYAADDGGKTQYIMANIPVHIMIPVMGADENSKIVTRFELCNLDAKTLNPRKLLIRANISAQISCFVPDKFILWDNLPEGEKAPVHILKKEIEHTLFMGVREKSFIVSDEYKLPPEKEHNSKMLSASTNLCVDDVKAVGNKVVIKAFANTTAVFLNESDGCLFDCIFSTGFSQIIEVETYGDNVYNTVFLQIKDAEFTMVSGRENGFVCSAQFNVMAQAVSKENKCSCYVADAYSNVYMLTTETSDTKLMSCHPEKTLVMSMRGKLQSEAELVEIMYAAVSEICTEFDANEITCHVQVGGIGKCEGGEAEAIELKLIAQECIALMKNQRLNIISVCCDKAAIIGTAQNAEFCVDVIIGYNIREFMDINAVNALDITDECITKRDNHPSLIVLCSDREYDIWSLAKKYGSTMDMIENANKIGDEFSIARRPLLIPRSK
ncbi:MAG: DUF3794 domain-containing protein [Oscillospiraceae bacterium]|nr:DUF3794 domain-containing protein [Oscillospiraceae bacterium]